MSFKPVESLSEQIASYLSDKIIRGEIQEKERIQELRIAGELEVSRGSVREALLILERRHLIEIIPRRGAVVTELSVSHVESLFEVFANLLGLLAKNVSIKWSGSDLDFLIKKFEMMRTASDRGEQLERVFGLGFEIMEEAYPIADNLYLTETLTNLLPMIQRSYFRALQTQKDSLEENITFFTRITDAVIKREDARVVELVTHYVENQRDAVLVTLNN